MRLAEALMLRADYQTKIEQLKKRIINNVKVQEGEQPAENPKELLDELDEIIVKLSELIKRINKTNSTTLFDESRTIADILAERDRIWQKRSILEKIVDASVIKQDRYSKSEIKFTRTLNIALIQKEMDTLSKEYRMIDAKIQETNWTTGLI